MSLEYDNKNSFKELENMESLKHQLASATVMNNQLKEKLESNNVAQLQLNQHIEFLNKQIDDLLRKLKASNIINIDSSGQITNLQNTMSILEQVSCLEFLKIVIVIYF